MNEQILPTLDLEVLRKKAQEAAMNGAMSEIRDFYEGYNSPYRKKIKEHLESMQINSHQIQLPEIIGLINDTLTKEIDSIANQAVSKSLVPMVKKFLTRAEKEMKFSDFLKEIIEDTHNYDMEDYSCECEKNTTHGWYDVLITFKGAEYKFTFHEDYESKKTNPGKYYRILSLPSCYDSTDRRFMRVKHDGAEIEIPFSHAVLQDDIVSLAARCIMANTKFEFDTFEFEEYMFPERCHCD